MGIRTWRRIGGLAMALVVSTVSMAQAQGTVVGTFRWQL